MIYLVYGAMGTLMVLALLLTGGFLGWKGREAAVRYSKKSAEQDVSVEQRQKMIEQQEAFEEMLRYNRDTAYAITSGVEMMRGGDGQ